MQKAFVKIRLFHESLVENFQQAARVMNNINNKSKAMSAQTLNIASVVEESEISAE